MPIIKKKKHPKKKLKSKFSLNKLNPIKRRQARRRKQAIVGGLVVAGLTVAALVAVTQLDKIREFFTQASGEEANIIINTEAVLGPVPRPWRNLAQGGETFDWRLQPLTTQVKALNPEYIRIDHIYDFYEIVGGSPGNLTFDFSKLDPILDDILATGATPFISLSYMPPAISAGDIVDAPHNWADWQLTIQKTIEHVSGTRGIDNVYYEVWNEPDLFGGWKYYGEKNYLTMYSYASAGAKNARGVKHFKLGGPGITALYKNWFDALAKHAISNNLKFDFFSWHRYNHNVNQYKKDMTQVRGWLQKYPQLEGLLELHITEWGHDSENHAGYDGNYGAAHTVAGAIEMVGIVDNAFVFEIQDGKDPQGQNYWGRWGLFTHESAGSRAKPRYQALRMLDKIGEMRLQLLGKGSWVKALAAKNIDGSVDLVLSNYDVYGRHAETVPVTYQNIRPGTYTVTKEFLNGQTQTEKVSASGDSLQIEVAMLANTVTFVKLTPDDKPPINRRTQPNDPGSIPPTTGTSNPAATNKPVINRRSGFVIE